MQAVAIANLRVASSLNWRCRPCGQKGKAAGGGMRERKRSTESPGVAGAACNGREIVQDGRSAAVVQNRQPVGIRREPKSHRAVAEVGGVHTTA